jgi:hypothetical protein
MDVPKRAGGTYTNSTTNSTLDFDRASNIRAVQHPADLQAGRVPAFLPSGVCPQRLLVPAVVTHPLPRRAPPRRSWVVMN